MEVMVLFLPFLLFPPALGLQGRFKAWDFDCTVDTGEKGVSSEIKRREEVSSVEEEM